MEGETETILITVILLVIIGLIVYFAYFSDNTNSTFQNAAKVDNNSLQNTLHMQNVSNQNLSDASDDNTSATQTEFVSLTAKLYNIDSINIINSDVIIKGNTYLGCNEESFSLTDPLLKNFNGSYNFKEKTLTGKTQEITIKDNILNLNCNLTGKEIDNISIAYFADTIEENFISGTIVTQELTKDLNQAYLILTDFNGTAAINSGFFELTGTSSSINITQNGTNVKISR